MFIRGLIARLIEKFFPEQLMYAHVPDIERNFDEFTISREHFLHRSFLCWHVTRM